MLNRIRQLVAGKLQKASLVLSTSTPKLGQEDLIEIKVNGMDEAKKNAVWLTKGLDRSQPAFVIHLVQCTSTHLKNIVLNKPNLSSDYRRIIELILEDRGDQIPDQNFTLPDPQHNFD